LCGSSSSDVPVAVARAAVVVRVLVTAVVLRDPRTMVPLVMALVMPSGVRIVRARLSDARPRAAGQHSEGEQPRRQPADPDSHGSSPSGSGGLVSPQDAASRGTLPVFTTPLGAAGNPGPSRLHRPGLGRGGPHGRGGGPAEPHIGVRPRLLRPAEGAELGLGDRRVTPAGS